MTDPPKCDFCWEPSRWSYGVEGSRPGYVMGKLFVPGETIHTCGRHGLALRRWAHQQEWKALEREALAQGA